MLRYNNKRGRQYLVPVKDQPICCIISVFVFLKKFTAWKEQGRSANENRHTLRRLSSRTDAQVITWVRHRYQGEVCIALSLVHLLGGGDTKKEGEHEIEMRRTTAGSESKGEWGHTDRWAESRFGRYLAFHTIISYRVSTPICDI